MQYIFCVIMINTNKPFKALIKINYPLLIIEDDL